MPEPNLASAGGSPDASGIRVVRANDAAAVARILATLPQWFGIPESNDHYVEAAASMPSYLAVTGDRVVGVLLTTIHFAEAAEVYLMAVDAAYRRRGIGTRLMEAARAELRRDGVRFLQVKTLGPSRPDENYAATRRFYERCGFTPLEELLQLWEGNPCLLMVAAL
ncbi:GNAT family N-acetyltransferase [Allobranchiibius huperziae]|uniref:Ribosomal protein S18 acetylase RimI-like enzyme n=1 Tax=Allobranchiibius huperziae TaxID=1874116 RepID=A0A853DBL9_9MICO|nr:ribosomal protein S18 acetylase RimI-like enzyme [Allobranchiibius huperziae]